MNWIQDFNVDHNKEMFNGLNLSLPEKTAQEIINESE